MLNGSLDTVALPDVLRLIASSAKSGLLRVEDASPSGRIFIVDGRIAFATTRNENDPIDDLLHMEYRADYVGTPDDRRIVDLSDLLENNPEAFNRFLEQMVVEVMSRLLRVSEGRFRFDVDIRSRREIPHSFDVEDLISQASARSTAWTRIFEVVPSASAPFRMAPRLSETEDIVLGRRDWALLASTGASTTIDQIAQELKIFEFAAAKKVAELTQRGLIEFANAGGGSQTSQAAAELLSGVVPAEAIEDFEVLEDKVSPPADIIVEAEAEEAISGDLPGLKEIPGPDAALEAEETAEAGGPTWLTVESEADDDDPVPLLEELHRLHEAENAVSQQADNGAEADEESDEDEDEDFDVDDIDGGDLATRWKNLRKAKRGAHASNE
ncbi:MAG: DUF4388 domain-containing protein [Acidimicrobiia bacterium]|nr:DUF4388 domain-containing protein [Acidimicrobiia bacterium]MDH3396474.1 DUF4388 domain-containing protein [Acidimicrobiia bacterium]MDH5616430.1 DUF4388 domain-containing protein [Acidimicrobiia bacterium]